MELQYVLEFVLPNWKCKFPTRVKAERQRERERDKNSRCNNGHTGANLDSIVGFPATGTGGQCVLHPSSITRIYCGFHPKFSASSETTFLFPFGSSYVCGYIGGLHSKEQYSEHCTHYLSGAHHTTHQRIQRNKIKRHITAPTQILFSYQRTSSSVVPYVHTTDLGIYYTRPCFSNSSRYSNTHEVRGKVKLSP
jgi:hypothetical protein